MKYALTIFSQAEHDAVACFEKLKRHSIQGAATWYAAYRAAALGLMNDAEVYAILPRRGSKKDPVRTKSFQTPHGKTYQLVYRIQGREVHVLRVWSPGQRPIRRKDLS